MKSNREIELLVEESVGLVHFIIKKYFSYTARKCKELDIYEDLVQEGMIGLYEAAKIFDESKGFKFNTLAGRCIHSSLKKFQDRYIKKNYRNDISLEKNVGKEGESEITMPIAFEEEGYKSIEYKEIMEKLDSYLNKEERIIIDLRMKGYSQRQIGEVIKRSQVEVSRKTKNIRKKLDALVEIGTVDKKLMNTGSVTERTQKKLNKQSEVKKLFEKGLTRKQISQELKMPLSSVSWYIRSA